MILKLFRALMPKNADFVSALHEHSLIVAEAAAVLASALTGQPPCDDVLKTICALEGKADDVARRVFEDLHKSFITPFDRSDISALATASDDTIDLIEDVVQRLSLYGIPAFTPAMAAQAAALAEGTAKVAAAFPLLNAPAKNAEAVTALGIEMSKIEGHADALLRGALKDIFASDMPPLRAMAHKEIHELLEAAVDRCEDVANLMQGVVIENV